MARTTRTTQHEPECRCTVPLDEIGGTLGIPPGHERSLAQHHGFSVTEDWAGRPAMPVGAAAEFATSYRRDCDAMSAKNEAYQRYLADRERKAQAEHQAAIQRAREESRAKNRKLAEAERAQAEQRAAQEAAERLAEDQKRRGNPVGFEDFDG